MSEEMNLARREEMPVAQPSVGMMLQAVIEKGVTSENVAAIEKLVGLYERMQDRDAEKAFAVAFNALQSEMPRIQATKPVPGNDGTIRYKFAPFEEIMAQVAPLLQRHGFTVCFSNRYEDNRIVETCILQHIGGHKRSNDFAVRIGSGPPKSSESQADGAAATYAKRFALTNALNIVVSGLDNDARLEGAYVSKDVAEELERRVKMINGDIPAFLKWAGAKSFAAIPETSYEKLDAFLKKKEALK